MCCFTSSFIVPHSHIHSKERVYRPGTPVVSRSLWHSGKLVSYWGHQVFRHVCPAERNGTCAGGRRVLFESSSLEELIPPVFRRSLSWVLVVCHSAFRKIHQNNGLIYLAWTMMSDEWWVMSDEPLNSSSISSPLLSFLCFIHSCYLCWTCTLYRTIPTQHDYYLLHNSKRG